MSARVVLEELRRRGGEATTDELARVHYLALRRLHALVHQGYVERVDRTHWRLTAFGRIGIASLQSPVEASA